MLYVVVHGHAVAWPAWLCAQFLVEAPLIADYFVVFVKFASLCCMWFDSVKLRLTLCCAV